MIEILMNSIQNRQAFSFPKALNAPLVRLAVSFTVIAAVFAVTCWHYISSRIFSAARNRDEMILSQFAPQPLWPTAISACIMPVIKTKGPFFSRKCIGEVSFSSIALLLVFTALDFSFFTVLFPIPFYEFSMLLLVCFIVTAADVSSSFGMTLIKSLGSFSIILWRFGIAPLAKIQTLATCSAQISFPSGAECLKIFRCWQKISFALGALFEWKGDVKHSAFTSHCLPSELSASDGKYRCSVISLADIFIIPPFSYMTSRKGVTNG